jgi:prepilin-type N-terminal cleavage/methylation domain-containing protein
MKNRAFTLLELLVVITIIGILSSIVIVSMSGSTDSATIAKGKAYAQQVHALLGHEARGVWNFDERTGITAYDVSGYGNNGNINKGGNGTGMDWIDSDIEGTALQFDGTDDYIDCGNDDSLKLNNGGTLAAWIKIYSLSAVWDNAVIHKGDGASWANCHYGITEYSGTDKLILTLSNGTNYLGGSAPKTETLEENIWYYIVATWDSSYKKIYTNGVQTESYQSAIMPKDTMAGCRVSIGKYYSSAYYFNGLIDDVRIYATALPSTEIQKHYVQGLEKLLINQAITQAEYDQRMEEFNQSLVSTRF